MSRFSRKYQAGDDVHINHLYNMITRTHRNLEEYAWEWKNTWHGPGSIWLEFDDERPLDDQLIGQYSLIPTPISFWGKTYLAGKTENCMSHPDFRGKGMYFFHEQKYFEKAKEKFQLFFTTTGDVAKGAPGKVRQKLGYRAFDYWAAYSCWLDKDQLRQEIKSNLPGPINRISWIGWTIASIFTHVIFRFSSPTKENQERSFKLHSEEEAPLEQIELLWKQNASHYGITVDRTAKYLKWRINENPYLVHKYLCCYEGDSLKGYIIYTTQSKTIHIVDILADRKLKTIFMSMLNKLKLIGQDKSFTLIKCYIPSRHSFLAEMLKAGKLINFSDLFSVKKSTQPTQLFVFVSDVIKTDQDLWDNQHWYLTDLVKEGRPYVARRNE
ncbi:hypothetical protein HQ531_05740 [bacterium]|nr:hypothetical protein [bacterium]